MRLHQIDPYVRFAAVVVGGSTATPVKVTDCRIFYAEEGQARIYINAEQCILEKGSLFYCPGGSIYRIQAQPELRLICINFDLTRSHRQDSQPFPICMRQELWDSMTVYRENLEDSPFLNSFLLIKDASAWYESIKELVREFDKNDQLSSLLCGSLLKTLLLRLHQTGRPELPPKLQLVQEFIRTNYKEPISNKQLGELTGYHEYYLNRTFKSYTGLTLHEFLVKVRMEQAAYLILNTQLPLSVIAEEVGIRSYPHFSSCFKEFYGCSPARFNLRGR